MPKSKATKEIKLAAPSTEDDPACPFINVEACPHPTGEGCPYDHLVAKKKMRVPAYCPL